MRTRIYSKLMNSEVEEYLNRNDIIIVPVGTVEMHGGMPLDCETVISEALALKMAEKCDGLMLPNLPYFYAGATASGRGTVQVSIRQGIDYLMGIAHSLLRQGFKRQIYISMHGPAHLTCSAMVRDFFDETGVPILYIDTTMFLTTHGELFANDKKDFAQMMKSFDSFIVGSYEVMGRLSDVPLTSEFSEMVMPSTAGFKSLFSQAYESGGIGYYFGKQSDHAPTTAIPDEKTRQELADAGKEMIEKMVAQMDVNKLCEDMAKLKDFEDNIKNTHPWVPSAYNTK